MTDTAGRAAPGKPRGPARVLRPVMPPPAAGGGKAVVRLAQSDILFANIQVIAQGGDNNLHSHAGMDGLWFVLSGRARFYGPGQTDVIGEVGPRESVFIPRNFPYWFEKIGIEPLEILQMEAIDRGVSNERTDYGALKPASTEATIYSIDGKLLKKGFEEKPGAEGGA